MSVVNIRNIIAFLVVLLVMNSCFKMSISLSGAKVPPGAETISVDFFTNEARIVQPELSENFTEALRVRMESQTGLKLVNGQGDMHFEGEIIRYDIAPSAITADEVAAQNRFTIAIKVRFINSIEPENGFEKTFTRFENLDSSVSFESVSDENTEVIIRQIIDDVFKEAFVNW